MRHTRACCRLQGRAAKAIVRFHMAGSAQRLEKLSLLDPCTRFRGHLTAPTHCITCWTTRQLLQLPTRTSGTLCSPHPSSETRSVGTRKSNVQVIIPRNPAVQFTMCHLMTRCGIPSPGRCRPGSPASQTSCCPASPLALVIGGHAERTLARGRNMFKCSAEECTSANPAHSHFGTVN